MAPKAGGRRIVGLSLLLAAALTVAAPPPTSAAERTTCRVHNVTQDMSGRSLIRMVEKADDGDRLRVRGTCPGPVVIDADLVIQGVGDHATVAGPGPGRRGRVVRITGAADVVLRDLIVERGSHSEGGGIRNAGTLRLVSVIARLNSAANRGGGIFSSGPLAMVDSVVRGNHSWYAGGLHLSGPTTLTRTRVVGNMASDQGDGGGVHSASSLTLVQCVVARNRVQFGGGGGIDNDGTVRLIDSRVSRNVVQEGFDASNGWGIGGGVINSGVLELVRSTVNENEAALEGGGIWNGSGGDVTLDASSSVTGNTPDDCVGTSACQP